MARRPIQTVADDFASLVEFLKASGKIPKNPSQHLVSTARRMHHATYSLILWKFRLKRLPEHSAVFAEEIASDALQVLPQALMGYSKTTQLLIRGIAENCLRHVYFTDHRIEFSHMNTQAKWYIKVEDLTTYAASHPDMVGPEAKFPAVAKLKSLYGDLSAGIHGRRVRDLEMRIALDKIRYDEAIMDARTAEAQRCAEAVNFVMAVFHRAQFRRFPPEDRLTIMRTIERSGRQVFGLQ